MASFFLNQIFHLSPKKKKKINKKQKKKREESHVCITYFFGNYESTHADLTQLQTLNQHIPFQIQFHTTNSIPQIEIAKPINMICKKT